MRLLLAEDDVALATEVASRLGAEGYVVDISREGEDALFQAGTGPYGALILDLGLPGIDGVTVLARLRESGSALPVLVLTARDRLADKAAAFRAGADDYLTKPFRIEELLLRINALLRRVAGHARARIAFGEVTLDTVTGAVEREGIPVRLTALEARILSYLAMRPDQVVSRADLTDHVYDHDSDRDFNSLEVIVSRLRRKLGAGLIETVRGAGYRLRRDGAADALA